VVLLQEVQGEVQAVVIQVLEMELVRQVQLFQEELEVGVEITELVVMEKQTEEVEVLEEDKTHPAVQVIQEVLIEVQDT
jgi:hypothetical protein